MKRAIISSFLAIAYFATDNKSYGQGSVIFANYSDNGAYYAPVTLWPSRVALGSDYTAQLLYSATGAQGTFAPIAGAISQFYGSDGDVADGAGLFAPQLVTVQNYVSGSAYFEVEVYNNVAKYYNVPPYPFPIYVPAGSVLAVSDLFEYSTLATTANLHVVGDPFPDNPDVVIPLEPFSVALIPEPTTIALSALGLVSMLAFRCRGSRHGSAGVQLSTSGKK